MQHNFPKHGLTGKRYRQMYEALFNQQNGLCAICGKHESEVYPKKPKKLCIDHCHVTGRIRGLLCEPCNLKLGDIENFGCDTLDNKISLEDLHAVSRVIWMDQELYGRLHEDSERWIQKHKDAVLRYLQ
jgi:Recombination endonuclease VII